MHAIILCFNVVARSSTNWLVFSTLSIFDQNFLMDNLGLSEVLPMDWAENSKLFSCKTLWNWLNGSKVRHCQTQRSVVWVPTIPSNFGSNLFKEWSGAVGGFTNGLAR